MDKTLRERENIPDGTPAFTLVNREDDSGDENLRKAKLEYHPIEIKEKYLVSLKSCPCTLAKVQRICHKENTRPFRML